MLCTLDVFQLHIKNNSLDSSFCLFIDFAQISRRLGEMWQLLSKKEKMVNNELIAPSYPFVFYSFFVLDIFCMFFWFAKYKAILCFKLLYINGL